MFFCPAAELCTSQFCLLSTPDCRPSVDAIHPVYFCIIVSSFLHYRVFISALSCLFFCIIVPSFLHYLVFFSALSCLLFCIILSSFLHSLVKYYFLSIYLWTLTIKFIFVCLSVCFYSTLL